MMKGLKCLCQHEADERRVFERPARLRGRFPPWQVKEDEARRRHQHTRHAELVRHHWTAADAHAHLGPRVADRLEAEPSIVGLLAIAQSRWSGD
eukprot:scaffold8318_cov99-Isochrysis_galbana.AAC.4